jgi:hypothetical protein
MYAALFVGHALLAGLDGAPCAASVRGWRVMGRGAHGVCSAQGAHWIQSSTFLEVKAKCGKKGRKKSFRIWKKITFRFIHVIIKNLTFKIHFPLPRWLCRHYKQHFLPFLGKNEREPLWERRNISYQLFYSNYHVIMSYVIPFHVFHTQLYQNLLFFILVF